MFFFSGWGTCWLQGRGVVAVEFFQFCHRTLPEKHFAGVKFCPEAHANPAIAAKNHNTDLTPSHV